MDEKLIEVSEAQSRLLQFFSSLPEEECLLHNALGRVAAEPIYSIMGLPSFTNSSMDGFAVKAEDTLQASKENPVKLKVIFEIPAGKIPLGKICSGEAACIMTGACLPDGSDSIIPFEEIGDEKFYPTSKYPAEIKIIKQSKTGAFIRYAGQDLRKGTLLIEKGDVLRSQDIAICASLGLTRLKVYQKPRVVILSTGDELVPIGKPLLKGQVFNSNSLMLKAMVEENSGFVTDCVNASDSEADIISTLNKIIEEKPDLIISSAGISVGFYDHLKNILLKRGFLDTWRVNIRPGKPFAFGAYGKIPFIALPGNPVSAFICFEVFVKLVLKQLSGRKDLQRETLSAMNIEDITSDGRESYLRALVEIKENAFYATLAGHQGSGNLYSLVQANALLIIPSGVKFLPAGSKVKIWLLG